MVTFSLAPDFQDQLAGMIKDGQNCAMCMPEAGDVLTPQFISNEGTKLTDVTDYISGLVDSSDSVYFVTGGDGTTKAVLIAFDNEADTDDDLAGTYVPTSGEVAKLLADVPEIKRVGGLAAVIPVTDTTRDEVLQDGTIKRQLESI